MASKVITLSLKEDVEKKLRELAISRYGKRKGFISKFLTETIEDLSSKQKMSKSDARIMEIIEKGPFGRGLIKYKSRDELHER